MQLSLRMATALKSELENFVEAIPTGPIDVSVYETDVPAAVAAGRAEILHDLETSARAEAVLSALSDAVEHAEVTSGVAKLLSEQDRLEARQSRLQDLASGVPVRVQHLMGRLDAARAHERPYRTDELAADVLSEEDLNTLRRDLTDVKRQLRELASTLADRQGSVTVELGEAHVAWFQEQAML